MYSLGSTVGTTKNDSVFLEQERNCTAIDKTTGEFCGETESLKILDEFQKLYETRIEDVDRELEGEFERVSMKLRIMKEWIRDLGEQNIMLVNTVEDLEQAACSRVKLLEEKLRQSSTLVSENMTRSNHTEKAINVLSERVHNLEKDESYMQQRIEFLQSDIRGLLELIRRARVENRWYLDGITFFEIEAKDIPAPLDCTCSQEETNNEKLQSLKLQVEQLQENEREMIAYQAGLEKKVSDLTTKLCVKENTIKKYISQLHSYNENLQKCSKFSEGISNSLVTGEEQQSSDIILMADIVERMLVEKDLAMKDLRQQLQNAESKLITEQQTNANVNDLKSQLNEKHRDIQRIEQQMTSLQKESLETRQALTAEVVEKHDTVMLLHKRIASLEEQFYDANMQIQFREDIIKELRKELKQMEIKDTRALQNVSVNTNTLKQEQVISCLIKTKSLMEKLKKVVSDLKLELERIVEKLHSKEKESTIYEKFVHVENIYKQLEDIQTFLKTYKNQVMDHPEPVEDLKKCIDSLLNNFQCIFQDKLEYQTSKNELDINGITHKLSRNIESVRKMYVETENAISMIDSVVKADHNCTCIEIPNAESNTDVRQQYKIMDMFKTCTSTAEDIRDEINLVAATFNSRNQKYVELNKKVATMHEQLTRTRERIVEAINRMQLQEEEKVRHNELIVSGKMKLKDMKNKMNHAQCRLSTQISDMQDNMQMQATFGYTEMSICNDLLSLAMDEIEQITSNVQLFQAQGCCITSVLGELKCQFHEVDFSIKDLQNKIDEALMEHNVTEATFCEKEQELERLEREINAIHRRIQDTLESFVSTNVQTSGGNTMDSQIHTQVIHEILRTRQNLQQQKKEYADLKYKMSQKILNVECDEKRCEWKRRGADLQDQIRSLQHEAKCKQEANDFLKRSMESLKEELRTTQAMADDYKRSHSTDNMELKKKIMELENAIKSQKETESTLREHLNDNEIELKRSKELLNSLHTEHGIDGMLQRCGCNQFRRETTNVPQLLKTVQNTMQSTKIGLQDLKIELKKLLCDGSPNCCSSMKSVMNLIDKLEKYEGELDSCSQEIDKLKNAICSKDKLLENMDEIIRIQKESIGMMQTEIKELHRKLQEKIDAQDQVISQYEKEKKELLKQNELQIQTIGHLQNAVVEAKRSIDQMGHKTASDLQDRADTIRLLSVYVEETQSQYNECFSEAAEQDTLLDLQRDSITNLQEKLHCLENDTCITIILLHTMYYSILTIVQEQLDARANDFRALKCKVYTLANSKNYFESKYLSAKKSWQEAEEKLHELKKSVRDGTKAYKNQECQCTVQVEDKVCITEDGLAFDDSSNSEQCKDFAHDHVLQSEIEILTRENEDMKRQLQKWKLDFDIIDKELKIERERDAYAQQITAELQKMKNAECSLRCENDQLKSELNARTKEAADLLQTRQIIKETSIKFEKLSKKLEEKEAEINCLRNQIECNEIVIKEQADTIEEFEKKLEMNVKQVKEYYTELNAAEEMISILRDRTQSLKVLLKDKSDNMAKLEANYEVLKNDNSILRTESNVFENKNKENVFQLRKKLKDTQLQLRITEDNYHRVCEDFNRTQDQLVKAAQREADLQGSLTNTDKQYCSKLLNVEKEKARLEDLAEKLGEQLEDIQKSYSSRNAEYCKLQSICKSYAEQVNTMKEQIEKEREKVISIEESNRCLIQQLQEYMEHNCSLVQERAVIEQNNYKLTAELQEMYKSLLELRKECQLKNDSLACISAELTQTALSRSELCNESQYVISCSRVLMEEQKKYVENLSAKLKTKQQQLLQLGFEKKALLVNIKELKRINNLLTQRLRRTHRPCRGVKSVCAGCYAAPTHQNAGTRFPVSFNYLRSHKKCPIGPMKVARRTSVCGNPFWFPRMEYLINELRKNNQWCNETFDNGENTETALEESRDCGYQSSTSK